MLPQSYPNYKTVHRRFQTWCCNEILRRVLTDVANELRDKGALDEEECFIDATFAMAKGGGSEIGTTKRGKGMKIMAIVDRHGLPLSVSTHAANHHEVRLVQLCFDFYMIEAKPENLVGDRAYDSDPLDEELRNDGIEMIAPHRSNRRKSATQDRRRLSRYMRRWLVERFFAWIQWQRRILVRWEYHAHNFLGFVQLACLIVLLRRYIVEDFSGQPGGGMIVLPNPVTNSNRGLIIALMAKYRLPAAYQIPVYVREGGLVSYGVDPALQFHQAASYVDRILKGARAAELPIQQATKFDLAVNLKTAKALGLTIPSGVMAIADEVIE
jgi:transposase